MRRALMGALLAAAVLPVGGCGAVIWYADYQLRERDPMTVAPALIDPVRDGRLYRNDQGGTLQVTGGRSLLLQGRCVRFRGHLTSTGRVRQKGPRVPLYHFEITEKVALDSRCRLRIANIKGIDISTSVADPAWLRRNPDRKYDPADWTIWVHEMQRGGAQDTAGEFIFSRSNTTIEDPR